jgi:flagellin
MASADVTRVASNLGALNALSSLNSINKQLSIHQSRLASGKRINSAADDPAGLTIATKLNARNEGLKIAMDNIGDAKNLLAVTESGMGRINDILVQMRNKAEQGASDTMGKTERQALVDQMASYAEQIDDIVNQTTWNGTKLLDGLVGFGGTLTFQTGADKGDITTLTGLTKLDATTLGIAVSGSSLAQNGTATGVVSASSAVAVGNSALTQIGAGNYNISIDYKATGEFAEVELFNAGDMVNPLTVDADGDGGTTTAIDNKVIVDLRAGGVVNFGNGLSVTLGAGVTGTASGSVTGYSPSMSGLKLHSATTGTDITKDSSASDFSTYMSDIQSKLDIVSGQLSKIGSLEGRLSFKEEQVAASQINVESSYSRIMNANMAEEQVSASKYQILQQTATAMLAQANAAPQFLLSLFR